VEARTWPCSPDDRFPIPFEPAPFKFEGLGPSWLLDSEGEVLLRCVCGCILGHPTAHSIEEDGKIDASIVCSQPSGGKAPCGWHVYGKLEGWTAGAMAAGTHKFVVRGTR
jgi:hypothetical protein